MNLEISEMQKWIIVRALYLLTSDKGLEQLQKDFPMMNIQTFGADTLDLMEKLGIKKEAKNETA